MKKIKYFINIKGINRPLILMDFNNIKTLDELSDDLNKSLNSVNVISFSTDKGVLLARSSDILSIQVEVLSDYNKKNYYKQNKYSESIDNHLEEKTQSEAIEDYPESVDVESEEEVDRLFYQNVDNTNKKSIECNIEELDAGLTTNNISS